MADSIKVFVPVTLAAFAALALASIAPAVSFYTTHGIGIYL